MNVSGGAGGSFPGLVRRAIAILLNPKSEWAVIAEEPATATSLYLDYVVVLAALQPFASFLHAQAVVAASPALGYWPALQDAVESALRSYVLGLAGVVVLAFIVDALAPSFDGQPNRIQALKLVAYGSTPSWLAGVFGQLPGLQMLAILGFYSLYLLWSGLPVLMKVPAEKALPYVALVLLVTTVLYMVTAQLVRVTAAG
jgi:hypothetical protein